MTMTIGSLFSGAGGLDLAVEQIFGGTTLWHSEIDKAASKVLEHRWPGVPNLGSITDIDFTQVEPVDVICGGFPCTDVSAAGKRAGMHGTRSGLWSYMCEAIDVLRPQYVVIENVRGLLSAHANRPMEPDSDAVGDIDPELVLRAAGAVCGDMADLGTYDLRWITVAASSVGAPHRRERVFILATDTSRNGRDERRPEPAGIVGGSDAAIRGHGHTASSDTLRAAVGQHAGGTPGTQTGPHSGDRLGDHRGKRADVELLPTPAAGNFNDGEDPETWLARRDAVKERLGNGNGMGMPLAIAVQLLPTPNAQEGNGGGRYSSEGHQSTLPGEVRLLPTPRTSDCFGAGVHGDGGMDLRTTVSLLPTPTTQPQTGNGHARNLGHEVKASQWGKYAPAITRWEEATRPAPAPTEPNTKGNPRLSAAFSEWLMGWPAGWVTDPTIGISRNDQLRIVGNGVVVLQAIHALRHLLELAQDG